MWPDRVSNPGPPTYESGALPIALRGPARSIIIMLNGNWYQGLNSKYINKTTCVILNRAYERNRKSY